jgi:hypothetical protein
VTSIHCEIASGGDQIVLVAGGLDINDIAFAARRLKGLTPLFTQSEPKGALLCPLTWPAVVQLSATFGDDFRPGPRLAAWTTEQIRARNSAPPITYAPPAPLQPYHWQSEGAAMIASVGRVLITDEPGTGKTVTTILGLVEWQQVYSPFTASGPILVVCPASVVDPWVEHWNTWAPHLKAVAWRGPKRKGLIGTADVYVMSYEIATRDAPVAGTKAMHPLTQGMKPAALVVDECFPAGTLVTTPTGYRDIETLRVGDEVLGVDHETGAPVVTTVRHTFERDTGTELVSVNGIEMTPNHPVWTARGYLQAKDVSALDFVCSIGLKYHHGNLHTDLRVVRPRVHETGQSERTAEVLQPGVLGALANVSPGVRGITRHRQAEGSGVGEPHALADQPRGSGEVVGVSAQRPKPLPRSGSTGQGSSGSAGEGLLDAERRQRPGSHGAPETARSAAGLGDGGRRADGSEVALPTRLQDRRGVAGTHDRSRGGRGEPQEQDSQDTGQPEGQPAAIAGVDGAEVLERRGAGRDGSSGEADHGGRRVYNIETGTGNYVVTSAFDFRGLLVHNCHYIKSPRAKRSQAVRRIAKAVRKRDGAVVGLSGTPITHGPSNLWPILEALEPLAWPSSERWVARYCEIVPGDYKDDELGLNRHTEPEFRLTLLGQHRRVAKADVLADLPPKVYSTRTVHLPTDWRKAYDEFESTMLAELPDDGGELSVMDVLTKFNLLTRLASTAADVEITYGPDIDEVTGEEKRHIHLVLKPPGWKVDAMLEVLAERVPDGQKSVVFAPSAQLIRLAGQAAAAEGYRVGYIIGGQSQTERTANREAFQSGALDAIFVTTGAGGVGLTLTAASTAVFLQRPWSLVESIQAEDRLHRIGAEHESIEIIDVIAANTIDTRIRAILRERAGVLSDLVQDPRLAAELLGGNSRAQPIAS